MGEGQEDGEEGEAGASRCRMMRAAAVYHMALNPTLTPICHNWRITCEKNDHSPMQANQAQLTFPSVAGHTNSSPDGPHLSQCLDPLSRDRRL